MADILTTFVSAILQINYFHGLNPTAPQWSRAGWENKAAAFLKSSLCFWGHTVCCSGTQKAAHFPSERSWQDQQCSPMEVFEACSSCCQQGRGGSSVHMQFLFLSCPRCSPSLRPVLQYFTLNIFTFFCNFCHNQCPDKSQVAFKSVIFPVSRCARGPGQ